jgi:AcrR family transcriptional regulator
VLSPRSTAPQRSHPRKTPKQARARATVVAIVEAAARILESAGSDGFSTNIVAERAGVSIGTLYQYFPDKEALLWALIVRETALLLDDAEAAKGAASGEAALAVLIRATVAHQLRRPALARLLDFEEARLPLDVDVQRVAERFLALLSDALAHPDLPPQAEKDTAARDVMAIIKGMIDAAGMHGETDQSHLAARVWRAVLGYLKYQA